MTRTNQPRFTAPSCWLPLALCALLVGAGCSPSSKQVEDPSVGMNGGFEHTRSGLPINWIVYTPDAVREGSCEVLLDDEDFKEGGQSLHFLVRDCSAEGGWHSPGITQEFPVTPGATYAIRFWIKSEGCAWTVSIGGVAAKTGEYERLESSEFPAVAWREVEREYTVPPDFQRLRLELSITSPGNLWIDDVRLEPLSRSPGE